MKVIKTHINSFISRINLDFVGMVLSITCAIHCLVLPIILMLNPYFANEHLYGQTTEQTIVVVSLTVAIVALSWGFLKHRKVVPLLICGAGAITMIIALVYLPHALEHIVMPIGAILLALSHWLNHRATHHA